LELDLLALELGLLALELDLFLLERCSDALQLSSLCLGLLSLLLRRSPLDVALTGDPLQHFLYRLQAHPQICHLGVGIDVLEHQASIVLPKPAHLRVQPGHLGALFARDAHQPLQEERRG